MHDAQASNLKAACSSKPEQMYKFYPCKLLRIMRLIAAILLLTIMHVSAASFGQRITLNEQKSSFENVLKQIRHQTGYDFIFERKLLKNIGLVDLKVTNATLDEALIALLNKVSAVPLTYTVEGKIVVIEVEKRSVQDRSTALVNPIDIKGKVVDEEGKPLIGASISIEYQDTSKVKDNGVETGKKRKVVAVTDIDGQFQLTGVDDKAYIVVSFIGYENQVLKAERNLGIIKMSVSAKDSKLGEVLVVGYNTQKKEALTGSIANVNSKDLERVKAVTASTMLAGKLAGVSYRNGDGRPGASANIQIRNMGNPLYVIDGIQKDAGQFNNISPNDIESITVLKDASAAVYGSRAANGVVVVTTKKGSNNKKPTINVDSYYGMQNWTRFPKLANAYQWKLGEVDAKINQSPTSAPASTMEEIEKWRIGADYDHSSFDWYKFIVGKNAPQMSLNANVSGGSDAFNYYLSATKLKQEAVYGKDFTFDRTNIQANFEAKITPALKVGLQMNGRVENRNNPNWSGNNIYGNAVNALTTNLPTEHAYANDNPAYINAIRNPGTNFAILKDKELSGESDDTWRIMQPNFTFTYTTPLKGLSFSGLYSYYIADDVLDNFEKVDFSTYRYDQAGDKYNLAQTVFSPYRNRVQSKIIENVYQARATYKATFDKHNVEALLLAERIDRSNKYSYQAATPKTTDLFLMQFPDLTAINYSDVLVQSARLGYVGKLNYNYAGRYYLEASIRRDASTIFPPKNRYGNFPSVSAGWRLTEERFFKNLEIDNVLNEVKLRGSYGVLGDDAIGLGDFFYLDAYRYNASIVALGGSNPVTSSRYNGVPTTNLSWFERRITDVGLDLGLFNNKLTATIDYFYAKRTGLRGRKNDIILPSELGYAIPEENLNSDAQMGGELALNYTGSVNEFKYSIGSNFSYSRAKFLNSYKPTFGNSWDQYRNSIENRWNPLFWGYQTIGQFQSYDQIRNYPVDIDGAGNTTLLPGDLIYKDINGDGKIDGFDMRPIGLPSAGQPIINMGLNFNFGYKGFDLSADFSGGAGYSYMLNYENRWAYQSGNALLARHYEDRWHRADPFDPNSEWIPGKNLPLRFNAGSTSNYNKSSDYWLTDVKYLRVRTLELGYTIPKNVTDKLKIQRLRIYVNTFNLFSIDNLKEFGLDPEIYLDNGRVHPQNKLTNFGINLTL